MKRLVALAISGGILLVAVGSVSAQYRYVDDKGVSKTTQYKLDVPKDFRDAAVWVGPTGIGKPGLSENQKAIAQRDEAYRRIGAANDGLAKYGGSEGTSNSSNRGVRASQMEAYKEQRLKGFANPLAKMCIAGVQKYMIGPGQWVNVGTCSAYGEE